jgi:hypothetical protein
MIEKLKLMSEKIRPKINLFDLMVTAARDCNSPTINIGFMDAQKSLQKIALRAAHLGDEEQITELIHLGLLIDGNETE